ncbi:MAG: hypothetical protein M1830_003965 [Pleopsidium flavum]|nr:MAG: hypothetical protein M1830_003965 [Pleopsidium flavum]
MPDDLTQLTILLSGPYGTPYSQGVWKLHLKIPEDYPKSPPKASFRTRIWHPNVEESTGSVCVDTLKRDWESKLTLRDVLMTISCLLIQPNPDSALNSVAGQLLQDDYEAFARQAKLMTSIHASIPSDLKEAVLAAKRRGEEAGTEIREDVEQRRATSQRATSLSQVIMKRRPQLPQLTSSRTQSALSIDRVQRASSELSAHNPSSQQPDEIEALDDDIDETTASKENDPSLSPSPISPAIPSPRRNILGKRPLSALPTPIDPDAEDEANSLSPSERNIANNAPYFPSDQHCTGAPGSRPRKSPKLAERSKEVNSSGRVRDDTDGAPVIRPFEDKDEAGTGKECVSLDEGKENVTEGNAWKEKSSVVKKGLPSAVVAKPAATRKVSTASTSSAGSGKNAKPRIGLRRL